ncbi:hypothetical protein Q1695_005601 [Nippostrongylus brasiliensis]|nr:hypothetical protein Q1695_005601 [Nippostrongylus brasiliensis]
MPQRLERTARALCIALNSALFLLSILLIAFVFLAAINAPKPDISPQPLNSYPQYIVTVLLIASYSCCLFLLNAVGFVAVCLPGSFLMSIHILGQVAMIVAQLIAVAFTLTVRQRLHLKLEDAWRDQPGCGKNGECQPVRRFLYSESLLIWIFCVFLFVQVIHLIASAIVCEIRSHTERRRLLKESEEEEDDD